MDKVNDEFGGINFKLSKDEYLFKLKDMECMTETRDEFLAVEVRPDKYIEQEHNILFVFNKRDVKQIIVDFDQKITYKSERNKEQIKQTNSYMGWIKNEARIALVLPELPRSNGTQSSISIIEHSWMGIDHV